MKKGNTRDVYDSLVRKTKKGRGEIIHLVTQIEALTEEIIISHFFPSFITDEMASDAIKKKRNEFVYTIIEQNLIGLMDRKEIIEKIVKLNYPNFKTYQDAVLKKRKYKKQFFPSLESVIQLRNVFAHTPIKFSIFDENSTDELILKKSVFKNGKFEDKVKFTEKELKYTVNLLLELINGLLILSQMVTLSTDVNLKAKGYRLDLIEEKPYYYPYEWDDYDENLKRKSYYEGD